MPKYSLIKCDEVGRRKIPVYKLCIDGKCIIDQDETEIKTEGTYTNEIPGLYAILGQACDLKALPKTKYHPLDLKGIGGNVHEAKTRNLRMYALQLSGSKKAIILVSKKTSQKADLRSLPSMIKAIEAQGELPIQELD